MRTTKQKRGEEGLVAILVSTIIMIILSLITLGFARLMQNEQRQALDRSLSTQAFYAAESAVNDAVRQIQDTVTPYTFDKTTCAQGGTPFTGSVDSAIGAQYTCLLIDQTPSTLEYTQGSISTAASKIIPINSENNSLIGQIRFAWEDPNNTAPVFACPASPSLPTFSGWNSLTPGILRLDVIPADALDRASLINNTLSLYLYPTSAGCNGVGTTVINYSAHNDPTEKGQIVKVNCSAGGTPRDCEVIISMDGASPNKKYYVRAKSIYRASDMTVRIFDTAPTPNQLAIRGAQVQIDATGKVNDVLRRVQVRVPVIKSYPVPEFVLQTTDSICKQIQVAPAPANLVDNSACPL